MDSRAYQVAQKRPRAGKLAISALPATSRGMRPYPLMASILAQGQEGRRSARRRTIFGTTSVAAGVPTAKQPRGCKNLAKSSRNCSQTADDASRRRASGTAIGRTPPPGLASGHKTAGASHGTSSGKSPLTTASTTSRKRPTAAPERRSTCRRSERRPVRPAAAPLGARWSRRRNTLGSTRRRGRTPFQSKGGGSRAAPSGLKRVRMRSSVAGLHGASPSDTNR